jgi:ESS family glutamate:Na+ symporter
MIDLSIFETFAIAVVMLSLGYYLQNRFSFLKNNYIPAPVIGGIITAVIVYLLQTSVNININFDLYLQPIFFAGFFASIGFRLTKKMIKNNQRELFVFLGVTILLATVQKIAALWIGPLFNLSSIEGMTVGSAHMSAGLIKENIVPTLVNMNNKVSALFGGTVLL